MKKFKKLTLFLVLVLTLSSLMSVCAFADDDRDLFDLGSYFVYLSPGDTLERQVFIDNTYEGSDTFSMYVVGKESKNTYAWSKSDKTGWNNIEIRVGKDETAKSFDVYVYVDGIERYSSIRVIMVDPSRSDIEATRKAAWAAKKEAQKTATGAPVVPAS